MLLVILNLLKSKMVYDDNKAEIYTILFSFFVFLTLFGNVHAFKIIPEDPYENQSLSICSKLYNSSNLTLDCVRFFDTLRHNKTFNLSGINNSIDNLSSIVLSKKDIVKLIKNETKNLSKYITFNEYKEIIKKDTQKVKEDLEGKFSKYIDSKIKNSSVDAEKQADRDHEYRMKELELNKKEEESSKKYTEEELNLRISEEIQKREPYIPPVPVQQNTMFGDIPPIMLIGFVVLVGILAFTYFKKKNAIDPSQNQYKYGGDEDRESPTEL